MDFDRPERTGPAQRLLLAALRETSRARETGHHHPGRGSLGQAGRVTRQIGLVDALAPQRLPAEFGNARQGLLNIVRILEEINGMSIDPPSLVGVMHHAGCGSSTPVSSRMASASDFPSTVVRSHKCRRESLW